MIETLRAARVVTADAVHAPGWVRVDGGEIVGVGGGGDSGGCGGGGGDGFAADAGGGVRDLGDAILVPGFIDIHAHGGGGGSYGAACLDQDPAVADAEASVRRACAAHLAHGTTTTLASLVTASPERLLAGVAALADLAERGEEGGSAIIRGIHLEGPWLSPVRAGAHAPGLLRHPDPRELDALLAAGRGRIRMVTIAPELPGALDAIRRIVDAGAVAAIGHTDADYETTRRAIDAGARVATHLFNAMRPLHHREPGPTLALMEDPRVSVELIADGVHLHPALVDGVRDAVGPDRVLLVTDAMDAAGYADGDYRLGELDVEVRGGIARLAGSDTIAGSTATMDAMFRAAAGAVGGAVAGGGSDAALDGAVPVGAVPTDAAPIDAALIAAVRQTSANQARVMGWTDVGGIAPGRRANLVVLDPSLRVREVLA